MEKYPRRKDKRTLSAWRGARPVVGGGSRSRVSRVDVAATRGSSVASLVSFWRRS